MLAVSRESEACQADGCAAAIMCAYLVIAGACRAVQPRVLAGLLLKALQQTALLRQSDC